MRREENKVSAEKFDILSSLITEIGNEVAEIVGGDPNGAYLYSEAGEGWIGTSVFKDEGEVVRYFDPTLELEELLLEFRKTEEAGKRWVIMEYEVKGTKFDAQFKYPEEVTVESFGDDDRREIALKKRYGDKPVIYPPWPGQPTE
jgi:hypothetical protein